MTFNIPDDVKSILSVLHQNGYEAYIVGGAIRDMLMNLCPKDYDIATNALPEDVEGLFEHTYPTGKAYGTITVVIHQTTYEVTTFRNECDYDGRRPKVVTFAKHIEDDLSRRDFTLNAMAMTSTGRLIDPYGGYHDIMNHTLHFVGDPDTRLREDRLRILRYIRFMCRFGFSSKHLDLKPVDLSCLSPERIRNELSLILLTDQPSRGMRLLHQHDLLKQILPEMMPNIGFHQHTPYHHLDVWEHTLCVLSETPPQLELRLAALLHDIGKAYTFTQDEKGVGHFYGHHRESVQLSQVLLRRLRYSEKTIQTVSLLIQHHMVSLKELSEKTVKKYLRVMGFETFQLWITLLTADRKGTKPPHDFSDIENLKTLSDRIISEKHPLDLHDLCVNGHDLMAIGIKGPAIGKMLHELLDYCLEDKTRNAKDSLMVYAKKSLQQSEHTCVEKPKALK